MLGQDKWESGTIGSILLGFELKLVHLLQFRHHCPFSWQHVSLEWASLTFETMWSCFPNTHGIPGKESLWVIIVARVECGVQTWCLESRYHWRSGLLAGTALLEWFPSLLHRFPEVGWWTLRGPTTHPTSVSLIFQAPSCFEVLRISVLSACGHNIQYINTHWRQFCLLESQVLQGYKSHLIPCKAQDTCQCPDPVSWCSQVITRVHLCSPLQQVPKVHAKYYINYHLIKYCYGLDWGEV